MPNYNITPANNQQPWGINILIYSTAGAGKTTLAASLADSEYGKPVLFVDAEGGTRVISHRSDIDIVNIVDTNAQGAVGFGWSRIIEVADDIAAGKLRKYKTIVFDNMSEYIDICIKHVIRTISRSIEAKDRPDQNDWGKSTSEMLTFTRRMRDYARVSGTNIIFIAWEIADKNTEGQVIKNGLLFNPALARKIPGIVDTVGFLTVPSSGVRQLSFEVSSRTDAKFRRNGTELATQIPDVLRWKGIDKAPLVDILATLKGNKPFPVSKYTNQSQQIVNTKKEVPSASS